MSSNNRFKKSIESLGDNNNIQNLEPEEFISENKSDSVSESSNMLSAILKTIPSREQIGKSVPLYLSFEVDEAITRISKQQGISKSKLVNIILKQVLLKD